MPTSRFSQFRARLSLRFGFDVFIAYHRQSAEAYTRRLHAALTSEPYRLVSFFDEQGFTPGTRLQSDTLVKLLFSHMLVVVFTPGAQVSPHVRREVRLFLAVRKWLFWNRRPISILDAQGQWKQLVESSAPESLDSPWRQLVLEARRDLLIYETETTFPSGQPSPAICKRYGEWKDFARLRRRDVNTVLGSVALALMLAILAIVLGWAARRAESALAEAEKARLSAVALKLGAQSQQALAEPNGKGALAAVLLAVESLRREPNLDASRTLQAGLELLPRPLESKTLWDGVDGDDYGWLAPSGDFALLRKASEEHRGMLMVKSVRNGKSEALPLAHTNLEVLGFSPSGNLVIMGASESGPDSKDPRKVSHIEVYALDGAKRIAAPIELEGEIQQPQAAGSAAVSADGRVVAAVVRASAKTSFQVSVVSLDTGRALQLGLAVSASAPFPVLSADGRWLAIGDPMLTNQSAVSVWDLKSLREIRATGAAPSVSLVHSAGVRNAAFSPDGRWLATAQLPFGFDASEQRLVGSHAVRLWDVATGREVADSMRHSAPIHQIAFSPDGRLLATADADDVIRVWDLTGRLLRVERREGQFSEGRPSVHMALLNQGLAVLRLRNPRSRKASPDSEAYIDLDLLVDFASLEPARNLISPVQIANSVQSSHSAFSLDGSSLAFAVSNRVELFRNEHPQWALSLPYEIQDLAFSPDARWLVLSGTGGELNAPTLEITVVATPTGLAQWHTRIPTEDGGKAYIANTGWVAAEIGLRWDHKSTNTLLFEGTATATRRWALGTPPPEFSPEHTNGWNWPHIGYFRPELAGISPDGKWILTADGIRDTRSGDVVWKVPPNAGGEAIGFDRSGKRVYIRLKDEKDTFTLWDPQTSTLVRRCCCTAAEPAALSPDQEYSLIVNHHLLLDRTFSLYRMQEGIELARMDFGGSVNAATFSADGKSILASGEGATLRRFLWRPQDLINAAQHYIPPDRNRAALLAPYTSEPLKPRRTNSSGN